MASKAVVLNVDFSEALGEEKLPYEQLLGDALDGNSTRFATQKIIEPVVKEHGIEGVFSMIIGRGSSIGEKLISDRRVPLISARGGLQRDGVKRKCEERA